MGQGLCRQRPQPHAVRAKALTLMSPGGAIMLTSSMASQRANGRNPAYEFSKAAQIALGRAIARAGEEKGHSLQCDRAGLHRFPDGPRCQPQAGRPRADGTVRPPGHRLGGRLCCAVPDFEWIHPATSTPTPCSWTPVIWPGSCGPSLHRPNGFRVPLGIAQSAVMPNSPLSIHPSGKSLHEPDQTFRALQAWRDHAAEPPRHGTARLRVSGAMTRRFGADASL